MEEKLKFQDLNRLHQSIWPELQDAFESVVKQSSFVQGPFVQEFEKNFGVYTGSPYTLGMSNGTDAIEVAIEALELKPGDIVALPSYTFAATAEAVVRLGGIPLFVDCDAETYLSEALHFSNAFGDKKIRGMIVVHLHGRAVQMGPIMELAKSKNLFVIEDSAQAHGAKIDGKHVGLFGDAGTFSFYPGKNLGALGDAGAVITKHKDLFEKMKLIRDHGRTQKYFHEYVGRNARMDGLQGAFLDVKLRHLPKWTESRKQIAKWYAYILSDVPGLARAKEPPHIEQHVYHNYVVRILKGDKTREQLMTYLKDKGIESLIHYPIGLHKQPAYAKYAQNVSLETTEVCVSQVLSLPIDPLFKQTDIERVANAVKEFMKKD